MKKFAIIIFIFLSLIGLSESFFYFVLNNLDNSNYYEIYLLEKTNADFEYEKSLIESINKQTDILANLNYYQKINSYRNNLQNSFKDVLNIFFDYQKALLLEELNNAQIKIANNNFKNSSSLYERQLISKDNFRKTELNLKELQLKIDIDNRNKEETIIKLNAFFEDNYDFELINLEIYDFRDIVINKDTFLNNNINLKISNLSLSMITYDYERLSPSSSPFDKLIITNNYKKEKLNNDIIRKNIEDSYKQLNNNLELLYNNLLIQRERIDIEKNIYDDDLRRFEAKIISENEYLNSKINLLSQKQNFYNSLHSYYDLIINYLFQSGLDVKVVLNEM